MLPLKVKLQKSPDYTFAVGRVRVWESKLLSASVFYHLADAGSFSELESVLNSTAYGRRIDISAYDYSFDTEEIAALKELRRFLKPARPPACFDKKRAGQILSGGNDKFLLPFFYKRDFFNLKLLAKSKFTDIEKDWVKEGLIEKEKVAEAISRQDLASLPRNYQNFLNEAWKAYEKTGDWQILDAFLEQRLYEQILSITEEFPFANYFFKAEIDLLNIKTFIRYKKSDAGADSFGRLFINGGLLDKYFFSGGSADNLLQRLKFTPYDILAELGTAENSNKFYGIENKCYLILLKFLSGAKYTSFGYEPILRYVFLKNNEIKNLRTVVVGKAHNIPSEEIKARIGPFDA